MAQQSLNKSQWDHNIQRNSDSNLEKQFDQNNGKKNFTVAVRIKPQLNPNASNLINLKVKKICPSADQLKVSLDGKKFQYNNYGQSTQKTYLFDQVYESQSQNHQIFASLIQKKLQLLQKGVNLSIMAYGATNSGKTYTIFGKNSEEQGKISVPGLSFLTLKKVFQEYNQSFHLSFSFVQIYNQNVYDLLNQDSVTLPLNVMENAEGNTNVVGLKKIQITTAQQLQILINQGNMARISCNNVHNMHSSRSHAFMQLELKNKVTRQRTKIVIVDLAGSQKYIYNATNGGALLKEGSNINKSLLSLGNCIKSLYENDLHVPYRDSKLTRLLKENLNGYAHNIMIACINKRANNFQENLNSLNYASKAIKIEKQLVRKIQSEEISEYQCTYCSQKLPFSLIKEINKHQDHKKRVKTRQSHSLSVSPIAKNNSDLLPFKSINSITKTTTKRLQKMIEQSFENMKKKLIEKAQFTQQVFEIIEEQKNTLKREIKQQMFNTKLKQSKQKQESFKKQFFVSQFQSPSSTSLEKQVKKNQEIKPTPVPERKVKISLSKPKKQLQNTATSLQSESNKTNFNQRSLYAPRYNLSNNLIKIQDDQMESISQIHSFRSNLTVDILDDKDKVLNERKQVLEEVTNSQKRKNSHSINLIKFKSTQNSLKNKAVSNFLTQKSFDDELKKINLPGKGNFIKIEESSKFDDIQPFEQFMINQRLLDSTCVAPRMRCDDDQISTWQNIVIKNVQSPTNIFSNPNKQVFEESIVKEIFRPRPQCISNKNTFMY